MREALAAHKADLLALLAAEDATGYRVGELVAYGAATPAVGDAEPPPEACSGCGRVNLGRLPGARIACECGTAYTRAQLGLGARLLAAPLQQRDPNPPSQRPPAPAR